MNKKQKNKILSLLLGIAAISVILILGFFIFFNKKQSIKTVRVVVKPAGAKILAEGMIRSENEVNLHFQTGGKLVYLPFKEGDRVWKGQTIASLDTYVLQEQLTAALNNYRATRDAFDQLQVNQQNNYLKAQQANPYPYNYFNLAGIGGTDKDNAVNDIIKRLIDETQAGLDNSVIQVELANYAFSLASINAPFDGIITHMDVTAPDTVVSPQTSFVLVDPASLVFRANVSENDINFIAESDRVSIQLTGMPDKTFDGFISKIYPDKVTLPTGENVYQVDVESPDLKSVAKYKQDGFVLIANKYDHEVFLVPAWVVLANQYVWVLDGKTPKLKTVVVGDQVGDFMEITGGLNPKDKVIVDPQAVIKKHYILL